MHWIRVNSTDAYKSDLKLMKPIDWKDARDQNIIGHALLIGLQVGLLIGIFL